MKQHTTFIFGFLTAVILAIRVVAQPVVMATPEPGMIAICANGQIVYVSLETGEAKTSDKVLHSGECPLSAGGTALAIIVAEFWRQHVSFEKQTYYFAKAFAHFAGSAKTHPARAPPVPI